MDIFLHIETTLEFEGKITCLITYRAANDHVDIEFTVCYSNFLTIMYDTKESCRVVFVDKFGIHWGIMTEQTEH